MKGRIRLDTRMARLEKFDLGRLLQTVDPKAGHRPRHAEEIVPGTYPTPSRAEWLGAFHNLLRYFIACAEVDEHETHPAVLHWLIDVLPRLHTRLEHQLRMSEHIKRVDEYHASNPNLPVEAVVAKLDLGLSLDNYYLLKRDGFLSYVQYVQEMRQNTEPSKAICRKVARDLEPIANSLFHAKRRHTAIDLWLSELGLQGDSTTSQPKAWQEIEDREIGSLVEANGKLSVKQALKKIAGARAQPIEDVCTAYRRHKAKLRAAAKKWKAKTTNKTER